MLNSVTLVFITLTDLFVLTENPAAADKMLAAGRVVHLPQGQAGSLLRFEVCILSSVSAASALAKPQVLDPDWTHPHNHS